MSMQSLGWIRTVCVLAALSGVGAMAVAADPMKPAATATASQTLSLAGGKLRFDLKGFDARALPVGTMYFDETSNQAIIITEGPLPVAAGDTSDKAYRVAVDTLKQKQKAASTNYQITGEKTTLVNGVKVYQLDATDDVGGMPLLMATLMAIDKQQITVIEVMSSAKDPARHTAAVKNIIGK
jgi:dipeptidyl aminopeptidase/acylaminoacyl peptidase